ncbi:hypothetical protein RHGRI_015756 [Rhododendron griersonianum]|uniref:Vacuolar ATPase assembly protein VMA22 n=1 Tax=Rhododendron griersonianum TaxID=479676 RepID=A0AAV6JSI1_9ERIC|nr:hypothetical protein RHGRI_015756 [Rhododendron griersonianum]
MHIVAWQLFQGAFGSFVLNGFLDSIFGTLPVQFSYLLLLVDSTVKEPDFNLCKWVSPDNNKSCSEEAKFDQDGLSERKSSNSQLRYRGTSEIQEKILESNGSTAAVEDQIQQERSKSLSMFGKLVSPKLRDAQLSFETALDILIEIANMRSSLLSAYDQVRKDMESTQG